MEKRTTVAMQWTAFLVLGVLVLAAVYDAVVVIRYGVDASISRFMQNVGFDSPFVTLVCGYLAGHFWGFVRPKDRKPEDTNTKTGVMSKTATTITATLIVASLYDAGAVFRFGAESSLSRFMQNSGFDSPFVTFVCGYLAGHFLGFLQPNEFRLNGSKK